MKSNSTRFIISGIIIVAIVLTIIVISYSALSQPELVSVDVVLTQLERNNVERINVVNDKVEVRYRDSEKKANNYDVYTFSRVAVEQIFLDYNQSRYAEIAASVAEALRWQIEEEIKFEQNVPFGKTPEEYREEEYEARFPALYDIALREELKKQKDGAGGRLVVIKYNDRNAGGVWNIIYPIGLLLLFAVVAVIFFRSISGQNKQAVNFGKTKTNLQTNLKVRFSDVAGAEEEKLELQEVVEFLKSPQKFTKVGAKIPRGVLLIGQPGTGKTLFAKAVAGEANVPFFSISGSDFVEMFVGVGASRVRDLFDQAKRNMPCIVFIDEIDAVGRLRGSGLGGGHDEREQTLNQLLVQMDGFETNEGIIVMAATNRSDVLDPALLRPGRFDRQVYIHLPDVRGREAIFKVHARFKPIASDVDFQVLARITQGFTGADIANTLNEAAIICARENRAEITMHDISEGIDKATLGIQKKSRVVTEFDKRVTAYHEAGHAIVARACPHCDPVYEVSVIPRGNGAGGFTQTRPENDNNLHTLNFWNDHIAFAMGGRAAEALVIEDITTGASSDIKNVTAIAHSMVTEWGMSGNPQLGQVYYGSNQEVFLGRDFGTAHNYSEVTAAEIDKEVSRIVEDAYKRAVEILQARRSELDVMARTLLECETIYTEEIDMIMNGESAENVKKALDERMKKKYAKIQ